MAGAFSGHLIQSHEQSSIVTSGAMSFNATMHGNTSYFASQMSGIPMSMPFTQNPFTNTNNPISEDTTQRIAQLQAKLTQKLGPEYVSQRPGPAGKLTYAEGWKIINLANEVFGFNGWSSNVISLTTDFIEKSDSSGRYNVGVTAIIRVTLRDGVYHEDVGYGMLENSKSQGQALDKCKKEAVTDGLKRALRNFGNLMGNCLYDKAYAQEIVKMKVPPARFDKSELHRRKEFAEPEETKPTIPPQPANNNNSRPPVPPFNAPSTSSTSTTTARQPQSNANASTPRVPQNPTTNMRTSINSNPNTSMNTSNMSISKPSNSTTSIPNQNVRSNQPQPQQPQQNRHVSFAQSSASTSVNPTRTDTAAAQTKSTALKVEHEDSFDFGDDDAFFAALDMGEADLGRPLEMETDTDLGQPIAYDETFDTTRNGDRSSVINDSTTNTSVGDNSKDQAAINKAARLQRLQQQIRSASLTVDDDEDGNGAVHDGKPFLSDELTMNTGSGSNNTRLFQKPIPQRQQQQQQQQQASTSMSTSTLNMNIQRNQNQRQPMKLSPVHDRDQNRNPNITTPSNSNDNANGKRPSTPSMGGFHFPPGINPLQMQNNSNGALNRSNGVKRPADAMGSDGGSGLGSSNGNGNGYRGSRPGMGLQQQGNQSIRREPFTPLEVGEGGDVKRIRR